MLYPSEPPGKIMYHIDFKVNIHCINSMCWYPQFLRLNYIVYMPHLVYLFIHWWTLGLFLSFALVVNAAMTMSVPISSPVPAFNLLIIYPDVKLVDHPLILFKILKNCHVFSTEANFALFLPWWIIWLFVDLPHFIYPFIHWWTFALFLPVGYCEQCYYQYIYTSVINSLGFISKSGVVESYVNCIL